MASLNYHLMRWEQKVRRTLAKIDNVSEASVHMALSKQNKFRLLTLRVWCIRYSVPLSFVLEVLLERYRYRKHKVQRNRTSLGAAIRVITGDAAQEYLEDKILEAFPAGENTAVQRSETRGKLLGISVSRKLKRVFDSPQDVAEKYQEYIERKRREDEQLTEKYQRAWRGRPW